MITGAQHGRHKREWDLVCATQGWNPKDDAVRLDFYRRNGLPASRADWSPKTHFDRFLEACKPLQNQIDIRDRVRETMIWRIKDDAKVLGTAYVAKMCADMYDRADWEALTTAALKNFRNLVHNRARARSRKAPADAGRTPAVEGNAPSFPTPPDESLSSEFVHTAASLAMGYEPPDDDDIPF